MKKLIRITAVIMILGLIVSCMTTAASAKKVSIAAAGGVIIYYINGDADNDGVVSIMDATMIQRVLASITKDKDGMIATRGDVDKNALTITDATLIQRYLAGFKDTHQIGVKMNTVKSGSVELPEDPL